MTHLALVVTILGAVQATPDASLTTDAHLAEVARYLYTWHLDENDVKPDVNRGEFVFWVRTVEPELDPGDESRFVEITLPRVGVRLAMKKADYAVPELDLHVRNERFMVTDVTRVPGTEAAPPTDTVEVRLDYVAMREHLFRTRSQLQPPGDVLVARMRGAAGEETREYLASRGRPFPSGRQAFHFAPISPIANEAWVFWEEGRLLFRFHADVDLDEPALWDHHDLAVQLFDLDEQVVVSLDEVAGSNAYVTRDMVGRVLYNCVVHGRRIVLAIAEEAGDPTAEAPAAADQ